MIKLLVGLGNPGLQYAKTRHNAGFWFIDALAQSLQPNTRFKGLIGEYFVGAEKVYILKPETFMNNSGESVLAVAHFYKILPQEILIAHDELDLPPGTIRYKKSGGHGGHNGLRSVITHLGSKEFHRLRVGIGHPGHGGSRAEKVLSHVLKKPSRGDEDLIFTAIDKARHTLDNYLIGNYEIAMNELHRHL